MLLYKGTSKDFISESCRGLIASRMETRFFDIFRFRPSEGEVQSWANSLKRLAEVFKGLGLTDHGVLLEYQLPLTSRRLDCLISGKDGQSQDNAVIIELKQWSTCQASEADGEVLVRFRDGLKEVLHPSVQVGQYALYLGDVNPVFYADHPVNLSACSYLHNYDVLDGDPVGDSKFDAVMEQYPMFSRNKEGGFEQFLTEHLSGGQGMSIAERIASAPVKTNKKLMDHVANVIHGKPEYVLLDEQKVIYDKIFAVVKRAYEQKRRQVVIIKGGPGTGKSVIALNLMADLLAKGYETHYATGSKAFTETLRKVIGPHSQAQFKYFNSYTQASVGSVPVIICDEAHRIRQTSNTQWTRINQRSNRPQIEELLRAGKVCVFFIDDKQAVRPNEIGSSKYIKECAEHFHFDLWEYELQAQFRCLGSASFMDWVDNTLALRKTPNTIWQARQEEFDFRILDTPHDVEDLLKERIQQGFTARMTAGFCWPWAKKLDPDGSLHKDVQLNGYARAWNAPPAMRGLPKSIPSASLWAYDPNGFEQVGCIYTAQGFEFDYAGVIFGRDLVYDMARQTWVGDKTHSCDGQVKKAQQEEFLKLVKNTYRVLLSRGMRGCYVYFEDEDTKNFVRSRIELD